jgi:hypothetical protein
MVLAFASGGGIVNALSSAMPVNRLYNSTSGQHLLTIDNNETTVLLSNPAWHNETSTFEAYPLDSGSCDAGQIPVYRLYNDVSGQHLLTADSNEETTLVQNSGTDHWFSEGVGFCDYSNQFEGSVPVYRLYNSVSGEHLLTGSYNEASSLNGANNWKIENSGNGGIVFYAQP